jgi:hypothetical protein
MATTDSSGLHDEAKIPDSKLPSISNYRRMRTKKLEQVEESRTGAPSSSIEIITTSPPRIIAAIRRDSAMNRKDMI